MHHTSITNFHEEKQKKERKKKIHEGRLENEYENIGEQYKSFFLFILSFF